MNPEIPKGDYCYGREGRIIPNENGGTFQIVRAICPHWGRDPGHHHQENGYCKLLGLRDWDHGTLLWDSIKECRINENYDDEEE